MKKYTYQNYYMKNTFLLFLFLFFISIFGIFLYQTAASQKKSDQEFKVATTIFPIADIIKNIGENNFEVVQLLPSGASPHTFEPSIKDKQALSEVDIIFYIGKGLDDWVLNLAADQEILLIDLSKEIDLIPVDEPDQHSDEDSDYNPHYWLSLDNAIKISEVISDNLSENDPNNKSSYQNNLSIYIAKLMDLKLEMHNNLSALENRQIITFHDAFPYFAREFNLEIVATIEEFPGKEPTSAYLKDIGNIIDSNKTRVLYKEPQLSDKVVTALAKDYKISIATLDPIGGVEGRSSYIEMIEYNVNTIVANN